MKRLVVDPDQITQFIHAIFPHLSDGQTISVRTYPDEGEEQKKATVIEAVKVNGSGLESVIEAAVRQAQLAADHRRPQVFCPPLGGFTNAIEPWRARQEDLTEGVALSVECDQAPETARQKLETLLGPATVVVASGGLWMDPATREFQEKLHLHWRLTEPATGDALADLKCARRLATALVGGDTTNVPIVHPIRWPGSWHRKGEPKLARIVVLREKQEIDLTTALEHLNAAAPAGEDPAEPKAESAQREARDGDPRPTRKLIQNIMSGTEYHPSLVPLSSRLVGQGMFPGAVVELLRELMDSVLPESRDLRWINRRNSIPDRVNSAVRKFGEAPGEPLFDPWDDYVVPKFPLGILPPLVQQFVTEQSRVVGCDPSALAMAVLAAFSGSLDHRIRLKMLRHGDWYVSPRLWVVLAGDPSRKKTPIIKAALAELEVHQNRIRKEHAEQVAEYERARKAWDKQSSEPEPDEPDKPPRFVVSDTTVEKLAEILARSARGVLIKRDELVGWIGSMEKYASGRGSSADRAFWLESYDGGPYTVDRVNRGEMYVPNLSVSLIGGIQPDKLKELHSLTSDGLLQRFLPVMMGPATFPVDAPSTATDAYRVLTQKLIAVTHRLIMDEGVSLSLADDALPVMEDLRRHLHELEQVAGSFATGFQGFLGKLPGVAGSLALILHLADDPHEALLRQVSRRTAENVKRLVLDFILPHAFEFYRTAETVTDGDRLQRVASWIITARKERFSGRDLLRNVRDLRNAPLREVHLRLSPLVAGGWLTPESPGPENRGWAVSPAVRQQFEERCRQEEARKAAVARLMNSPRKATAV